MSQISRAGELAAIAYVPLEVYENRTTRIGK